ncbi:tetratricopeptide repeat protein [Legionella spiritensis]|uniref:Sporulation related domain protein n=1 Tax=Legionella spiritensis TaxID=452 RepID=A0A0W0YXT6_LEGSP|nr:tetratricopeptide repeat protein [Legionella spiritensis]KTD61689.1 Sporulation related domain protein [Legionella spiritensis]SNV38929.1 Predicted O-linked N-acetylglucosamine transferase, SPINDLY family [Legionella spiritensis]
MRRTALIICFAYLLMGQAQAVPTRKAITIFGLEQAGQFKNDNPYTTYTIQAGSFSKRPNAVKYKAMLSNRIDIPVRIVTINQKQMLYRVIIGPVKDTDTLHEVSRRLLTKPAGYHKSQSIPTSLSPDKKRNPQNFIAFPARDKKISEKQTRTDDNDKDNYRSAIIPIRLTHQQSGNQLGTPVKYHIPLTDRIFPGVSPSRENKSQSRLSGNPPLFLLAAAGEGGSEMAIPINSPAPTDSDSSDETISFIKNGTKVTINLTRYDPKIYRLAHSVFVMNGEVVFAYKVAKAAVKYDPKSIEWRQKLAEVSLWSGNSEVALDQYLYFINHNIEPEKYADKALTLAGQLSNYDAQVTILRYLMKQHPNSPDLFLKYIIAVQKQGFPQKALRVLKKIAGVDNNLVYLRQMAAITEGIDEPDKQIRYLKRIIAIDKSDNNAKMALASLLSSRGDFQAAYQLYTEAAATTPSEEVNFWNNYASISLLSGHIRPAIMAYKKLLRIKSLDKSSALQLVFMQQLEGQSARTYRDAIIIYRQYPDINLAKTILSLGIDLNLWQELKRFLDALSPQQMAALRNRPQDSIAIANIIQHAGLVMEAHDEWQRIFRRWPALDIVQSSYLWFLIDNNDIKQLTYTLDRWSRILGFKPALWEVYSSALNQIGDYKNALRIMKQHRSTVNNDVSMLINIAGLFTQNDRNFEAYYLQRRAIYLLSGQLSGIPIDKIPFTQQFLVAQLMSGHAPQSMIYNSMVLFSQYLFKNSQVDDLILDWALGQRNYDLGNYIVNIHNATGLATAPWMQLTLALENNDQDLLQLLLSDYQDLLPYRDRVTAATRTGNLTLAENLAYKGLEEHPQDSDMYDLFIDTMLPRSNKISAGIAEQTWGNVYGPITRLSARVFVTPSLSVTPYARAWFPRTDDRAIVATTPSVDETVGILLRKYVKRGWWQLKLAERKSLDNFFPISYRWHRDNLVHKLDMDITLGYHSRADETTNLVLGGMKNELKLGFNYFTDSYNLYDMQVSMNQFLGQDGLHLGDGQTLDVHWQHRFYLEYPDWNINLYGTWLNYQTNTGTLSPLLQTLIPAGSDPLIAFYMPVSDINGAVTFGFGQQYRKQYTHSWKPFGEAGVIYSKVFTWGAVAQGGIATSVFGRDHLVLYAEYTVNQQQVNQQQLTNQRQESQILYLIGISYDYYF